MQNLKLVGVGASPYTRKLRAAMRYRRLPYHFVIVGSKEAQSLPPAPRPLVPYLVVPGVGDEGLVAHSDTTPILNQLEEAYPERPLRPTDPALRLIDAMIEDYGDEWLSKCMFHYRWANAEDAKHASSYLPYGQMIDMSPDQGQAAGEAFSARQISRIGVVGSNDITAPIIEASWRRYLKIFDAHIQNQPYLLGHRPGAGDFACYGQMTMLVITDPTPAAVAAEVSPRAYAWTERLEDVSGLEVEDSDWIAMDAPPETLRALLSEMGRVYVPFMLGNAAAVEAGADQVNYEIDGQPWVQEPFVYQAKCLRWLREDYAALSDADKARVDDLLSGTGCDALFT